MTHRLVLLRLMMLVAVIGAIGCNTDDARLVELAEISSDRQAEQNHQMAELQQHVAEGSKELVTADAAARKEIASLSRELQSERAEIGRQRDALETERQQIAAQRYRDPLVATAITSAAWIVACLLPLVICVYLLRRPVASSEADADALVTQLLLEDLVADESVLLPRQATRRALPAPISSGAAHGDASDEPSDDASDDAAGAGEPASRR